MSQGNYKPCTPKQAATLEKYGYNSNVSASEASRIIDALAANGWKRPQHNQQGGGQQQGGGNKSNPNNPATARQRGILEKYGYTAPMTFQQASEVIDQIAAAGWPEPAAWAARFQAPAQPPQVPYNPAPVPQGPAPGPYGYPPAQAPYAGPPVAPPQQQYVPPQQPQYPPQGQYPPQQSAVYPPQQQYPQGGGYNGGEEVPNFGN